MLPYQRLGVRRVINAAGTLTRLGGSLMPPEVLEAMEQASRWFVDLDELQVSIGRRIAELTRNEDAYVSCGAAAGIYLALAALLRRRVEFAERPLPPSVSSQYEVIIHRAHRTDYDVVVPQLGLTLREVGEIGERAQADPLEFEEAMGPNTLAVLYVVSGWLPPGGPDLDRLVSLARQFSVPVIVDAAAQLPPVENLWRFTKELGADIAVFSGGKDLRGPSGTGLVVGRTDLIADMRHLGYPHHGVGRVLEVGKEEMVGLLTAVERYVHLDHQTRAAWMEDQVRSIQRELEGLQGVRVLRSFPNEAGQPIPRAYIRLEPGKAPVTRDELIEELLRGDPVIEVLPGQDGVYVNPMTLEPGEASQIARRVREIVLKASNTRGEYTYEPSRG